jgi:hypothetical protein
MSRDAAVFTLVRHSGYAVRGDAAFDGAVEVAEITAGQAYTVKSAGGVLFASREAAAAAAEANRMGPGGRIAAAGHFSSLRVAGAEIYVPA